MITSNRGLLPEDTAVTSDELRAFASTDIHAGEPDYREPLVRDVERLVRTTDPGVPPAELVLLGSVATGKYVDVLLDVVGEQLLFPTEFVGRGDMSRGALLLRASRAGSELAYEPVATAVRHGSRPAKPGERDGSHDGASAPRPLHPHRR